MHCKTPSSDHWMPSKCKMVVVLVDFANALVTHIDPAQPHAWRKEPFCSGIRQWAQAAARTQRQVIAGRQQQDGDLTGGTDRSW